MCSSCTIFWRAHHFCRSRSLHRCSPFQRPRSCSPRRLQSLQRLPGRAFQQASRHHFRCRPPRCLHRVEAAVQRCSRRCCRSQDCHRCRPPRGFCTKPVPAMLLRTPVTGMMLPRNSRRPRARGYCLSAYLAIRCPRQAQTTRPQASHITSMNYHVSDWLQYSKYSTLPCTLSRGAILN